MKRLDPQFPIKNNEGKVKGKSEVLNIEICPRVDHEKATPRILLSKENITFASTNDNIGILVAILAVKNIVVYIIGTYDLSNNIYAYKVIRDNRFFEFLERVKDMRSRPMGKLFKPVNKKET